MPPCPDIQDLLHLGGEDLARAAYGCPVVLASQQGRCSNSSSWRPTEEAFQRIVGLGAPATPKRALDLAGVKQATEERELLLDDAVHAAVVAGPGERQACGPHRPPRHCQDHPR
jgi:hypothetical protein